MLSTKDSLEAIVSWLKGKKLWREVKLYPKGRVQDPVFNTDLMKLSLPACLVMFSDDVVKGQPRQRNCDIELILIESGSIEGCQLEIFKKLDSIRDDTNRVLLPNLHLTPDSESKALDSAAQFCAHSLDLHTREFS